MVPASSSQHSSNPAPFTCGLQAGPSAPFCSSFQFLPAVPGLSTKGTWPYMFQALKTPSIVGACRSPVQKHPELASEASWALQEKGKAKGYSTGLLSRHTEPTL